MVIGNSSKYKKYGVRQVIKLTCDLFINSLSLLILTEPKRPMKHFLIILLVSYILPIKLSGQEFLGSKIEVFINLAEENYSKANYDLALINLDSASGIDPDIAKIYKIRGMIYNKRKESRRAINEFNNAIRFDSEDPETYYYRSLVRHDVGDHRNYSLNDINTAIELNQIMIFTIYKKLITLQVPPILSRNIILQLKV